MAQPRVLVRERNLNKIKKYNVEKECIDEFQARRKGCCEGASYDMYACQGNQWIYGIKKGNEEALQELPSRTETRKDHRNMISRTKMKRTETKEKKKIYKSKEGQTG